MSEDDDIDFTSTNQSARNLASLFHGGSESIAAPAATYVPPKQPRKDATPKVLIAGVIQAFCFGADQKWTARGKMGVALLSTDNTLFQLILYLSKTQQITSARITSTFVITPQANNYLSFQDDGGQNWSIMFDSKQTIVDFGLQIVLIKAYLSAFKFDHITQDVRDGEGSALVDQDSVEIIVHIYKLLENGTLSAAETGDNKPLRVKIGKQHHGKIIDDILRGMKKNGHRVTMVGTTVYSIEVVRIKREKEGRSGSASTVVEEPTVVERKRTITEDVEMNNEKSKMLQRINKMGGVSMLSNPGNSNSAFAAPTHPQLPMLSDDDSISNEMPPNIVVPRPLPVAASAPTPTPAQFAPAMYHHQQALLHQPTLFPPQQLHDYNSRPGSSMSGMAYPQAPMWPPSQYPHPTVTPTVTPTDMYYQQHLHTDLRQSLTRLTEKVDSLTDKFDAKNSTSYPNMETSILLANIQRIVKENDTVKKDLFDRSAKVEELNAKISDLLDRNQKLIEQSHQTAEQRNVVVNNVSEQTAQKFLDLEKQKVELTNNLSVATSKIADLQLQLNQYSQDTNENQSRVSTLLHRCEQLKDDLAKSESQRSELQMKFDSTQEQLRNEKIVKKQLQTNVSTLEDELAELKVMCNNLERANTERKVKHESERKRWHDEMEEQKTVHESELDVLRTKLRKQRTVDNLTNNQEITRIEQDLQREWQEKLDRQQAHHERILTVKGKEFDEIKAELNDNETKMQQTREELDESKHQLEVYEERCEKLQERLLLMKEKLIEMNEEQPQLINDQVKRVVNIIFQRLKTRIRPNKRYTGEIFLSRSLDIIKKATLKVLSSNEDEEGEGEEEEEQISDEIESADEQEEKSIVTIIPEEVPKVDDPPANGNKVDQSTLSDAFLSTEPPQPPTPQEDHQQEVLPFEPVINQKNGWDTLDEFQEETSPATETVQQNVEEFQQQTSSASETVEQNVNEVQQEIPAAPETVVETEAVPSEIEQESNPLPDNNESVPPPSSTIIEEEHNSDASIDTIEEDNKEKPPELELSPEKDESDTDNELFQSARPSIQDIPPPIATQPTQPPPRYSFHENIPLMTNAENESEDELFK